ncbi:hypothetical protein A9Z42_0054990 [Trichoderma parareesei]|uniref:Uncharacterized protein n=1 Tax=Trichoderma parareesei TaxID=858221 RepID=A0A2H2ZGI8_TRIPA|nr:hypothetical protein A9Z42_0054990 [Trichoderma parareesei]
MHDYAETFDRPGIQFFSVTNHQKDGDELKTLRVQCRLGSECATGHGSRYCLAAPKLGSGEDVGHSWTGNHNPSTYLLNHGLFSACPESRKVAQKAYRIWDSEKALAEVQSRVPRAPGPIHGSARVPFVASSRNGEEWQFQINPSSDLVCLQPLDPTTICLNRRFMEDLCVAQVQLSVPPLQRAKRALVFADNNQSRQTNVSLWLIDYSLKRERTSVVTGRGQEFYGIGQKFVEVDDGTITDYSTGELGSALDFLRDLDRLFCGLRPCHILWHYRMKEPAECTVCRQTRVHGYRASQAGRVVACEKSA